MPSITFTDLAGLYATALHQSTEETRYYLNGVYVEPYRGEHGHGARLVATDGHRLSVSYDPGAMVSDDTGASVILPIDKSLYRHLTNRKAERAAWDGETLTVFDFNDSPLGMAPCRPIDGTFPDWTRVVPSECSHSSPGIAFDPKLLATYEKIAKAFGEACLHITPNGDGPAWITLGGVKSWHGVLMPMRGDATKHVQLPSWVRGEASAEKMEA